MTKARRRTRSAREVILADEVNARIVGEARRALSVVTGAARDLVAVGRGIERTGCEIVVDDVGGDELHARGVALRAQADAAAALAAVLLDRAGRLLALGATRLAVESTEVASDGGQ